MKFEQELSCQATLCSEIIKLYIFHHCIKERERERDETTIIQSMFRIINYDVIIDYF